MKQLHFVYVSMLIFLAGIFTWSAIHPLKLGIWFFEVIPGVLLIVILLKTHRRFPLTPFAYTIVFIAVATVFVGGHYTYEKVPLFNYIKEAWHLSRNPSDRLGHFFQGMTTTVLAKEFFIGISLIKPKKWLNTISISICLAFSAGYEIFEWIMGLIFSANVQHFLGYQGDVWDSHWDILCAVLGGIVVLVLSKWHDKQIATILTTKKNRS